MTQTQRFAVVGHPIEHSISPRIHQRFAADLGIDLVYEKRLAARDGFAANVAEFFAAGGAGLNVTVPFKGDAFRWVDETTPLAQAAQAVNTIVPRGARYVGANTDGLGLLKDLCGNLDWRLKGRQILLLGAGGAIRGVLQPLLEQHPARIVIANRTVARALSLAAEFSQPSCPVEAISFATLQAAHDAYDCIVNGTSLGLDGVVAPLPPEVARAAYCYDMSYGAGAVFQRWAEANGAVAADGLGMLVEQAAEAFALWHGQRPATEALLAELRQES